MLSRLISGLVMAASIIAVLLLTPWWGMGLVVLAALLICAREYQRMARPDAPIFDRVVFVAAALAVCSWPIVAKLVPGFTHGAGFLLGFFILTFGRLARPHPIETSLDRFSRDGLGLLYLGVPFPYVFLLREAPEGGWLLLMVMAITFLSDAGGYFAGRLLGKHKLYPAVSPKKTIEGMIGGLMLATAAPFVARAFFPGHGYLTVVDCIVLGVVGALFAVSGDLAESLMKRAFKVKDSGTLIPGHGGLLDRIDGLLFAGPFCWFYLEYLA